MTYEVGDPRPSGTEGRVGDTREAGESGPAGDMRPAGEETPTQGSSENEDPTPSSDDDAPQSSSEDHPSQSSSDGDYDPADYTVDEVNERLAQVDDAEQSRILADERNGKGRIGIIGD